MNTFAIDEARKPSRIGSIAIISGALLGAVATGPAFSADLPYDSGPYRSGYYRDSYYGGCYRCSCCGRRIAPVVEQFPVEERPPFPVVERIPMAERHWVQRDYIERRYPYYPGPRYAYPGRFRYSYYPGPGADPYSYDQGPPGYGQGPPGYDQGPPGYGQGPPGYGQGPPGYGQGPPGYGQVPPGEPRRFSHGGGRYPPAPAAYEYQAEPRPPRYAASSRPDYRPAHEHEYRPSYEYEMSPRPPVTVPTGYFNPGYAE